jgi:hypothetical protein
VIKTTQGLQANFYVLPAGAMNKRITVRLSKDLLDLAARKAAAEGRTLASLIEEGLRSVTAEDRTAEKDVKVSPRVGTAIGGPTPGGDVADQSALQETDAPGNVERIKRFKALGRKGRA